MTPGRPFSTVARLTPPGVAAIAVLRLTGPLNAPFAAAHLSRPLQSNRCVHGDLFDATNVIDDVVAVRHDDGTIDLNLHGGVWVVQAATDLVIRFGYTIVQWQDVCDDADDAIERQVLLDLPHARSREAVRLLTAQPAAWRAMRGPAALGRALADTALQRLLTTPTVAIVGPPNAGKSTLANALIGQDRNITAALPGTTRDWTSHLADMGGLVVRLVDTPGVRDTHDAIEAAAIAHGRPVVRAADMVLLVIDGAVDADESSHALRHEHPTATVVLTKTDRPRRAAIDGISASAVTGDGLDTLRAHVRHRLGCDDVTTPYARCWTETQRDAVRAELAGATRASTIDPRRPAGDGPTS